MHIRKGTNVEIPMDEIQPLVASDSASSSPFTQQRKASVPHRDPSGSKLSVINNESQALQEKIDERRKAFDDACQAIEEGNISDLKRILEKDAEKHVEIGVYQLPEKIAERDHFKEIDGGHTFQLKSLTEWSERWSLLHVAVDAFSNILEESRGLENSKHLEICRYLISEKKMSSATGELQGYSPLHIAAWAGNEELIAMMLDSEEGSRIDPTSLPNRETPLHMALLQRRTEAARLLLERGASVTTESRQHMAALEYAVLRDDEAENCKDWFENVFQPILKETFEQNQNLVDYFKRRANVFHLMAKEKSNKYLRHIVEYIQKEDDSDEEEFKEKLRQLLNAGKNEIPEQRLAVMNNNAGFIEVISDFMELDGSIVLEAAKYGFPDIVEIFLKKCPQLLLVTDANGRNVLHLAAMCKAYSVVDELCKMNENDFDELRNMRDKKQHTPSYYAAKFDFDRKNFEKIVSSPEDSTSAIFENAIERKPLLHVAAKYGRKEIVEYLLEQSWDVNIQNSYNQNALMIASIFGQTEIVKTLYNFNKSLIFHGDKDNNSALHLAILYDQTQVVKYFLTCTPLFELGTRNTRQEDALSLAIRNCKYDSVEAILELCDDREHVLNGYDPSTTAENDGERLGESLVNGRTNPDLPLILAAKKGQSKIVELLLKKGADRNKRNHEDKTALGIACENRDMDTVKLLLQSDITSIDYCKQSLPDILRQFPKAGILILDRFEIDTDGNCPLFSISREEYSKYAEDHQKRDKHPLVCLAKTKDPDLLKHHTVTEYCRVQWNCGSGRIYYHLGVIFYLLLNVSFWAFIAYTNEPYKGRCSSSCYVHDNSSTFWDRVSLLINNEKSRTREDGFFEENIGQVLNHYPAKRSIADEYGHNRSMNSEDEPFEETCSVKFNPSSWLVVVCLVCLFIQFVKEGFQVFVRKRAYFQQKENYFELLILGLMIFIVLYHSACTDCVMKEYTWCVAAITQALGWINLAVMLTKYPGIGYYLTVFLKTMKTYARFLCVFLPFFFAFSTSFSTLMRNRCDFGTFTSSFSRIIVMMTGEFDFHDLFYPSENDYRQRMLNFTTTMILFLLFCVVINILLSDVLTGLAVDNTKDALEKAKIEGRATQMNQIVEIQFLAAQFHVVDEYINILQNSKVFNCILFPFWILWMLISKICFLKVIGPWLWKLIVKVLLLKEIDDFLCKADIDEEDENPESIKCLEEEISRLKDIIKDLKSAQEEERQAANATSRAIMEKLDQINNSIISPAQVHARISSAPQ